VLGDGAAQEPFAAELIAVWIAEVLAPAASRHPPAGSSGDGDGDGGAGVGGSGTGFPVGPEVGEETTREVCAVADE
jgi:hypothetical protein